MASTAVTLFTLATAAFAQIAPRPNEPLNADPTDTSNPRLVGKAFPFDNLPEMADTSTGNRGTQSGYNRCNSTTEGASSLCQTLIVNSIKDFCVWGPPTANQTIGNTEDREVAWCTQPGHGARLIPPGTFTGLQWIRAPSYIVLTANLDQTKINVAPASNGDGGGELDSGGQDDRGNPLGALVYSNSLPSSKGQVIQARTWNMFIGNNVICAKFCDPNAPDAAALCEHRDDTIGCNYNIPAAYTDGVFLDCEGDDQTPVGIYTAGGQTLSWNQDQGLPPPYQPTIPATRSCTTYQSAELFAAATSTSSSSSSTASSGAGSSKGSSASSGSGSTSSGASKPTNTNAARQAARGTSAGVALALVGGAAMIIGAALVA